MTGRDLTYYVDRLRYPRTEPILQRNDAGVECITYVRHDALLTQLRAAIYSGIGRTGNSGTQGASRLPIDSGALALYEQLERQIADNYTKLTGEAPPPEIDRVLTLWYQAHMNARRDGDLTDDAHEYALRQTRAWVEQIEAKFDPPRTLELMVERVTTVPVWRDVSTYMDARPRREKVGDREVRKLIPAPCPRCHERYGTDKTTGDRVLSMLLEYRVSGSLMDSLHAMCRHCGAEWFGTAAGRELQAAIQEVDEQQQRHGAA